MASKKLNWRSVIVKSYSYLKYSFAEKRRHIIKRFTRLGYLELPRVVRNYQQKPTNASTLSCNFSKESFPKGAKNKRDTADKSVRRSRLV